MDKTNNRARPWLVAAARKRLDAQVERLESLAFPVGYLAAREIKDDGRRAYCEYHALAGMFMTEDYGDEGTSLPLSISDPVGGNRANFPDWL